MFDLLVAGETNDDIAAKALDLQAHGGNSSLRVMTKLAADSLGDLFKLAIRHGLVGRREPESR